MRHTIWPSVSPFLILSRYPLHLVLVDFVLVHFAVIHPVFAYLVFALVLEIFLRFAVLTN